MTQTPSPEAVERMARAMAENEGWRWSQDDGPPNMVNEAWNEQATSRARSTWRNRARAALAAYHAGQSHPIGE